MLSDIVTPYQKAKQVWDERLGSAYTQVKYWRGLAILLACCSFFLIVILMLSIMLYRPKVFVAEVSQQGQVINTVLLSTPYQASIAQEEYFLAQFIKLTRSLPLDPVLAKQNLLTAYSFLTARAAEQLNNYFKKNDPLAQLGKETISVSIDDISPFSKNSYHITWTETVVNMQGNVQSTQRYSALLSIMLKAPAKQSDILNNPLGIYISDFHISPEDEK